MKKIKFNTNDKRDDLTNKIYSPKDTSKLFYSKTEESRSYTTDNNISSKNLTKFINVKGSCSDCLKLQLKITQLQFEINQLLNNISNGNEVIEDKKNQLDFDSIANTINNITQNYKVLLAKINKENSIIEDNIKSDCSQYQLQLQTICKELNQYANEKNELVISNIIVKIIAVISDKYNYSNQMLSIIRDVHNTYDKELTNFNYILICEMENINRLLLK